LERCRTTYGELLASKRQQRVKAKAETVLKDVDGSLAQTASHCTQRYCTCFYPKRVRDKQTGLPGVAWFRWGRCKWCVQQRRDANLADMQECFARPASGFFVAIHKADEADIDDVVRKVREAGGGVVQIHLPDDTTKAFVTDRPILGGRAVSLEEATAFASENNAKTVPRGKGKPMVTFCGTWKKKPKEKPESTIEVLGRCSWTVAAILALCLSLGVGWRSRKTGGGILCRLEFLTTDPWTEEVLMSRLSGPSPCEVAPGEGPDSAGKHDWEQLNRLWAERVEDVEAVNSG
jgi:hypothetical protein